MTDKERVLKYVGNHAEISDGNGLTFHVKITDVRNTYGNDQVKVTTLSGHGERWVMVSSVKRVGLFNSLPTAQGGD